MSGITSYTITLDALASYSGNNAPDFLLLVDGQQVASGVVSSYNPATQSFSVPIIAGEPHTISIVYSNYATSGQLLNLLSLGINGQTIQSSDASEDYVSAKGTVASTGQMVDGGQVNFAVPASYFPAPVGTTTSTTPSPVTIGSGPDTLSLSISEDAYLGDAQFTVSVDGVQQGGIQTATASHAAGQNQTFDVEGSFGSGAHTVTVDFLNDAYGGSASTDRNLYVTSATIDGVTVAGAILNEATSGAQNFTIGSSTTTTTATPPVSTGPITIGSGTDTLALSVSEDAYQGDAQFTISVDGVQQGGVQTATASHAAGETQIFDIEGNYGSSAHVVTVDFLNDAYGGSSSEDRNLYVTGTTIDGKAVPGAVLNEYSNGSMSFTVNPNTVAVVTPPVTSAFYVSASGSDTGSGTAAHPFATLQYALGQMEKDSVHTLYVGSGTYAEASAVTLTAADSGDNIFAAAGASPVLNATGGNSTIISLAGAQNVTISGFTLENAAYNQQSGALFLSGSSGDNIIGNTFVNNGQGAMFAAASSNDTFTENQISNSAYSGVEIKDGSNSDVFSDNTINGVGAIDVSGAGFFGHGISNDVFENNLVENTAGAGFAIEDYGQGLTLNSGNTITENEILNTSTSPLSTDDGAIYLLGRSDNNLQTTVSMNLISGSGNVSSNAHVEGIYLDDNASGVTVTGNIIQGIQDDDTEVHGGYNDQFTNNIFNLGNGTRTVALIQQPEPNQPATVQSALTNDSYSGNIITSQQTTPYYTYVYFDPEAVNISISNNLYYDQNIPAGGLPDTYGIYFNPNTPAGGLPMVAPVADSKPVVGNPNFVTSAFGSYGIGAGSAATQIGFVPINQALIGPH